MDPTHLFADERLRGFCVYCGGEPQTSDHAPSRILLDDPLPNNVPVVECCQKCNAGFSSDEQYFACLIECVITGSVSPADLSRERIRRTMLRRPHLAESIAGGREDDLFGGITWRPDFQRVRNVILKLARAHIAFELSLPQFDEPEICWFQPLVTLSVDQRKEFEDPIHVSAIGWPEIGSRAFIRACKSFPLVEDHGWQVVQADRYRYRVDQIDGNSVQLVLSEYLGAKIVWA